MKETTCDLIDSFLDDDMNQMDRDSFQNHVTECPQCALAIANQSAMDSALRSYAETLEPKTKMVFPPAHSVLPLEATPTFWRRNALALAEACAVAMVVAAIWYALNNTHSQQSNPQRQVTQNPVEQVTPELEAKDEQPSEESVAPAPPDFAIIRRSRGQLEMELRRKEIALKTFVLSKAARDEITAQIDPINVERRMTLLQIRRNKHAESFGEDHRDVKKIDRTIDMVRKQISQMIFHVADADDRVSVQINKELVPVLIERNKFAAQYGENHPTVKALDAELQMMKDELKRIVGKQSERIRLIQEENANDLLDDESFLVTLIVREKQATLLGADHPIPAALHLLIDATKSNYQKYVLLTGGAEEAVAKLRATQKRVLEKRDPDRHIRDVVEKEMSWLINQIRNQATAQNSDESTPAANEARIKIQGLRAEIDFLKQALSELGEVDRGAKTTADSHPGPKPAPASNK